MSLARNTADDDKMTAGWLFPVILMLLSFLGNAFWDRGTTFKVQTTALAIVAVLVAVPVCLRTLYHWFGSRQKLEPPPHWNLKADSPGRWALVGLGNAGLQVVCIVFAAYLLMSMFSQHVRGSRTRVPATVETVEVNSTGKGRCKTRADFRGDNSEHLSTCLIPRFGPALADRAVQIGDAVVLEINESVFGSAVVGVELDELKGAQQTAARDRVKKRGA